MRGGRPEPGGPPTVVAPDIALHGVSDAPHTAGEVVAGRGAETEPFAHRPSLPAAFYDRPVVDVARELLGCTLVHGPCAARIVETEAYHDSEPACHGYGTPPRATRRTAPLFGPPGRAYVYRSYGIHAMLNAVCEREGTAAAVLIRAVEPIAGIELMRARRAGRRDSELTNGPGKLAEALGVELDLDGSDLVAGPIRLVAPDPLDRPVRLATGIRIGITKAVELPWRFADASSSDVSRPRLVAPID